MPGAKWELPNATASGKIPGPCTIGTKFDTRRPHAWPSLLTNINSANMDTVERPLKIRRIEHDDHDDETHTALPAPEDTAPSVAAIDGAPGDPPLSKNQRKKLRKQEEWESKREERKIIRKEKLTAKRERKRAARDQEMENGQQPKKPRSHQPAVQLPVTILIDCDFDDLMTDGERTSLGSQITRSYSDNKNSPFRAHLAISSFGGQLRKRFDTVLHQYKLWKGVRTFDCDFVETAENAKAWMSEPEGGKMVGVFKKYADLDEEEHLKLRGEGEVVYLSSEADEDLTELKPYSTYIIGGLVDKNREKGICFRRATQRSIRTAKLPIGEYMNMQSRKVLTTNHVNEIMLKWLECGDWGEAFMKVIPKRKGGKLKGADDEAGGSEIDPWENDFPDQEPEPHAGSEDDDNADGGVPITDTTEKGPNN